MFTSAPVCSSIPRIVLPLGPMMSPILSGFTCNVMMRGAIGARLERGFSNVLSMMSRICMRA